MSFESNYINESAVKRLALKCSKESRAAKFKRVGSSFYSRINAQVPHVLAAELEKEEVPFYIKKTEVKKLAQRMVEEKGIKRKLDGATFKKVNDRIREIIAGEVQRHPSIGKTLQ